jgi:hypothetical protein
MIGFRLAAFVVVAALLPLGCDLGGSSDPEPPRTTATASKPEPKPAPPRTLCGRVRARVTGHISAGAATELSGLVLSRSRAHVLWTHNDSGDRPRLLAVSFAGKLLADVAVTGAGATDWEDVAAAGDSIYVGDIGDNTATRPEVVVYRVPEPGFDQTATAPAQALTLRYPDHPHDAEALLVDPSSGALVIVTKSFGGVARLYVADDPSAGSLRLAGRLKLGAGEAVTAGDVSADGHTVAVRTYTSAFVWSRRRAKQPLPAVMKRRPCRVRADLLVEGQGESLALIRDGRAFYTVPEGVHPALRRYAPATSALR